MKKLLTLLLAVLLLAGCAGNKSRNIRSGQEYLSAEWETVRGQSGRGALSTHSP